MCGGYWQEYGADGHHPQPCHHPCVDLGHGVGQVWVIAHRGVDAADQYQVEIAGETLAITPCRNDRVLKTGIYQLTGKMTNYLNSASISFIMVSVPFRTKARRLLFSLSILYLKYVC